MQTEVITRSQCEKEAVRSIRGRHPHIPTRTLARKILTGRDDFLNTMTYVPEFIQEDFDSCLRISYKATFASIYNRIRRCDGSIK